MKNSVFCSQRNSSFSGELLQGGGGLAEYAIAPTSTTIKRRHEVTPIQGSAMGISGFAALQSVRNSAGIDIEGRSKETKNLLIRGASGGVGTLAVQVHHHAIPQKKKKKKENKNNTLQFSSFSR
jgi:NADPH:quinone reductase-like Zn-dependent oxidoreductase